MFLKLGGIHEERMKAVISVIYVHINNYKITEIWWNS